MYTMSISVLLGLSCLLLVSNGVLGVGNGEDTAGSSSVPPAEGDSAGSSSVPPAEGDLAGSSFATPVGGDPYVIHTNPPAGGSDGNSSEPPMAARVKLERREDYTGGAHGLAYVYVNQPGSPAGWMPLCYSNVDNRLQGRAICRSLGFSYGDTWGGEPEYNDLWARPPMFGLGCANDRRSLEECQYFAGIYVSKECPGNQAHYISCQN